MSLRPWKLFRRIASDPVSDAALLARFAEQRDAAAFELLVWRHGAMVLGVCRRVLRNDHDADDAFQAAFLILARKASSVRGDSLAGWLHRVARRVAVRAAKRPRPESLTFDPPDRIAPDAELRAILDAEIDRLPDRFRLPVVLCYLDGRSTEDAAKQLGIPRGTVLSRLATARKKLAERLTRRGITATLFATGFVGDAITANAVEECTAAALRFAAGVGGVTVSIQLAEGVLRMGTRLKLAGWALALVMVAGLGTGVGVVAGNAPQGKADAKKADPAPAEKVVAKVVEAQKPPTEEEKRRIAELSDAKEQARLEVARASRIRQLDEQARKLQDLIAKQMDHLTVLRREEGGTVDVTALQSAIAKTDEQILLLEERRDSAGTELGNAQAALKDLGKIQPAPEVLNVFARDFPEVQMAIEEYQRATKTLEQIKQNKAPDSALLTQAEKNVKDKSAQVGAARLAVLPAAEKAWSERETKSIQEHIKSQSRILENTKQQLETALSKRQRLTERYAKAKQAADRIQLIEDELKVYREVRQLVIRQRLMLEIGLDEAK